MAGSMESLAILNSVVRTLLALLLLGAIGLASWFGYSSYYAHDLELEEKDRALTSAQAELEAKGRELQSQSQQLARQQALLAEQSDQIVKLEVDVQQKEEEIQRLDTSLRLLKVDQRLARVTVLEVEQDPESGQTHSTLEYVELDDDGKMLHEPRRFRLEGDMVYVDYWIVKFDDQYVEQADLHRATSITLFRRIFGEFQEPRDGYVLDQPGERPQVYGRGSQMSEFERQIWDDFWNIANDPARAQALGIRAAHGQAVSIRVQQGTSYKLQLRASDGLSIVPEQDAPPRLTKPPA